jgi:hypothetical protein
MSKAARDKSNPVAPRIVVSACATQGSDVALKGFIDDWFVPALVEDYIRRHQKPAVPVDRDTECDSQKAKSEG